jgi:hypothetical protein
MAAAALLGVGTWLHERGGDEVTASPREYAEKMRFLAADSCARARWAECARMLDRAREADPEGEADERVRTLRRALATHDAGEPVTPR